MKLATAFALTLIPVLADAAAYPADGIGNRMEHCQVDSVTGSWAMANYPTGIDLYYGALLDDSKPETGWHGFIAFSYPSNDRQFPLDKTTLYPVTITFTQTATYAGDTAKGTTQPITFKEVHYDSTTKLDSYELKYKQGNGIYKCQHAWPINFPH